MTLAHTDLDEANLSGAKLPKSDLKGADLRGANLTGIDFTGIDVTDVIFSGFCPKVTKAKVSARENPYTNMMGTIVCQKTSQKPWKPD